MKQEEVIAKLMDAGFDEGRRLSDGDIMMTKKDNHFTTVYACVSADGEEINGEPAELYLSRVG